jgi:hypothetical protein
MWILAQKCMDIMITSLPLLMLIHITVQTVASLAHMLYVTKVRYSPRFG